MDHGRQDYVEIPYRKSVLYFTFPEFFEALKRGRAFKRAKELREREDRVHVAAAQLAL